MAGHWYRPAEKHDDDDDCMVMRAGHLIFDLHLSVSELELGDTLCIHILAFCFVSVIKEPIPEWVGTDVYQLKDSW